MTEAEPPKQPETWRVASPAYDYSFKELFGLSQNKELLIHFLNCLFFPDSQENEEKIRDLEPVNLRTVKGSEEKQTEEDMKCICTVYSLATEGSAKKQHKYKFSLEMQRYATKWFFKRTMYYGSEFFTTKNPSGIGYDAVPPVKVVSLIRKTSYKIPDGKLIRRCRMMSRWENLEGDSTTDWEETNAGSVELIEFYLSSIDSSYASGTPFQQWLAFFDIEALFEDSQEEDGYVIRLNSDVFSDAHVVKALEVMKKIVETDFMKYRSVAAAERAKEEELILSLQEAALERMAKEEAIKTAEKEREEKEKERKEKEKEREEKEKAIKKAEEAMKRAEEERLEKEKAMKIVRELQEELSRYAPPAKK